MCVCVFFVCVCFFFFFLLPAYTHGGLRFIISPEGVFCSLHLFDSGEINLWAGTKARLSALAPR